MSQKYLFPRSKKQDVRLPAHQLFGSDPARFRGRAAKYGREDGPLLWSAAMEHGHEGRLLPPVPLSDGGDPLSWRSRRYNVSFRIGVLQSDNLRACGDLNHSMANLAYTVETPIRLLSWG